MANLEEEVKDILLGILDVKPEEIVPSAAFIDDLRATSIDIVEILTAMQNKFDVNITDNDAQKLRTVQDVLDLLKTLIAEKDSKS